MADLKIATVQPLGILNESVLEPANMSSEGANANDMLLADGAGTISWDKPDPANMASGAATVGQVLTADGAQGASWQDAAGGAVDELRTLYVGKHGSDTNDGKNVGAAFLTIGAAITAATGLTPTVSSPVAIKIVDSGSYNESIVVPSHVLVDGPNAQMTYSQTGVDVIQINDGSFVRLHKVTCGGTSAYCITSATSATGTVRFHINELVQTGSGRLIGNRGSSSLLIAKADLVTVNGVQRGAFESASNGPVVLDIQKITLALSGAYGILNLNSVAIKGRIGSINKASAGLTGTVGIVGGSSQFGLVCGEIEADTAIDTPGGQTMAIVVGLVNGVISVAGTLYLTVGRHIGSLTATGTAYIIESNGSVNRGIGVWGKTPPSSQPAKISDPIDLASALTAVAAIIDVLEGAGLSSAI